MLSDLSKDSLRFVVVGNGKTAVDIARILASCNRVKLAALLGDSSNEAAQSSLSTEAKLLDVPYLETRSLSDQDSLDFVRKADPDYIISANNFILFKQSMLDIPTIATVNFHNGPLPSYAGLNPYCWAIINDETNYGVSWHLVEASIDSGPVLHIAKFELGCQPKAVTTLIKCIREGVRSFSEHVLPKLLERQHSGTPQDQCARHYYSGANIPFQGILPWWESNDTLERWARALAFSPLPNIFYRPQLQVANIGPVWGERIQFKIFESGQKPGEIIHIDANEIHVATQAGCILIDGIFSKSNQLIDPMKLGLAVGQRLVDESSLIL